MRPWKALHCLKPHAKSNRVHGKSRVVQITQNPHSLAPRGLTKKRPSRGESPLAFTPRICQSIVHSFVCWGPCPLPSNHRSLKTFTSDSDQFCKNYTCNPVGCLFAYTGGKYLCSFFNCTAATPKKPTQGKYSCS